MNRRRKLLSSAALALLITPSAWSFTLNSTSGSLRGYTGDEVQVYLNPSNCSASIYGDIVAAADFLNRVPTSGLKLSFKGDTTSASAANIISQVSGNSFSEDMIITCSTDYLTDSTSSPNSSIAIGFSAAFDGTHITIGGVIINEDSGQVYSNLNSTKRKIVLAHEMGHVLGLGHSEEPGALMHYSIAEKTELRLHQDDVDGFTFLYPRDELFDDGPLGCARVSGQLPPPPSRGLTLLLWLMIPLIWIKKGQLRKAGLEKTS